MRQFATGATRNANGNKPVYNGFLSNEAIRAFGAYMHEHRVQSDGSIRDPDNWKQGMPLSAYMESAMRHIMDWRALHESGDKTIVDSDGHEVDMEHVLCAVFFNVQGYLHEFITKTYAQSDPFN